MQPATGHAHAKDRWPQALTALLVVNSFKLHLNAFNLWLKRRLPEWLNNKRNGRKWKAWTRIWSWDYGEQIELAVRAGLELGASKLQVQHFSHSARLPPSWQFADWHVPSNNGSSSFLVSKKWELSQDRYESLLCSSLYCRCRSVQS